MSRATTKRAEAVRNWSALLKRLRDDEASVTPEAMEIWLRGKWSDPRPRWDVEYLNAMQSALEQRDRGELLKMLDAGVPIISDALLPLIAEVIRDVLQGRSTGAPIGLTALDDEKVRRLFDWATTHGKMNKTNARYWLSEAMLVSVDSIKRSLSRTKSPE
jgi:hypothetical protein